MPMPGGPADKLGNRYEKKWAICQLVDLLDGRIDLLSIEQVGETWAEFRTESEGSSTWHQVKRRYSSGANTIKALEEVLTKFATKLRLGEACAFASSDGCADLRELTDRATSAQSPQDFKTAWTTAKTQQAHLKTLEGIWGVRDSVIYEWLQLVQVKTIDEELLEKMNLAYAKLSISGNAKVAHAVLGEIYEESVHEVLDRADLVARLEEYGLRVIDLPSPTLVNAVTTAQGIALTQQRARLVQGASVIHQALISVAKLARLSPKPGETRSDWVSQADTTSETSPQYSDVLRKSRQLVHAVTDTGTSAVTIEQSADSLSEALQRREDELKTLQAQTWNQLDDVRTKVDWIRMSLGKKYQQDHEKVEAELHGRPEYERMSGLDTEMDFLQAQADEVRSLEVRSLRPIIAFLAAEGV